MTRFVSKLIFNELRQIERSYRCCLASLYKILLYSDIFLSFLSTHIFIILCPLDLYISNIHINVAMIKKIIFNFVGVGLNIKLTEGDSAENTNHPGVNIAINQSPNVTTNNTKVTISFPDRAIIVIWNNIIKNV